jgi:type IV secretion system coupling TraD/TrwB family protein
MRELTLLGRTTWREAGRPFGIPQEDRRAHVYIIGKTGTGKSSLLETMIRQDISRGRGLALLDPHGDLAYRVMKWTPEERKRDVINVDVPNPDQSMGFNPLAKVPERSRSLAANAIVEALKKIFADSWGIRLEYILRNSILLLLDQENATIADVLRLFHEPDYRREAIGRATNDHVRRFWTKEFEAYPGRFRTEAISPIENKLGSFLVDPFVSRILTAKESTFDPRDAMENRKLLIVNLAKGKIGESPAMLFGSMLVAMLGVAGLARGDSSERPDFHVYLDEFQTFTTLALANMLAELRKYGVGLTLANQYLEQLVPEVRNAILGNVGTLAVFRIGASDAERLAKELGHEARAEDLTLLPNRNFWIRALVDGEAVSPFTAETITLKG